MTDQQKRDFRSIYNDLRKRALQPGEGLVLAHLEYDGEKRHYVSNREWMQKWKAA